MSDQLQWQDEPGGEGWYYIEGCKPGVQFWIYQIEETGEWIAHNFGRLQGRRVAKVLEPTYLSIADSSLKMPS